MADRNSARNGMAKFPGAYRRALHSHLKPKARSRSGSAGRIGLRACDLGIGTLELARIHDAAHSSLATPPANGARSGRAVDVRAASFFAEVVAPIEATHLAARGESPATSTVEYLALLKRSRAMEEELRQLSRTLLTSHEEERRRISRELHDTLGQNLSAVNIGLASLVAAAAVDSKAFRGSVSRTQRLVQKSMRTVHQFARHLRPSLLDDLGLVPALVGYAREFGKANGIKVVVTAPEESASLDGDRRTALFRVAQEALVNVGRHAGAGNVRVTLRTTPAGVRLEVWNDGTPFDVEKAMHCRTNRHLGLLCMRERIDMVGGTFSIQSSKALGTTVRAIVPLPEPARA